MEGGVDQPMHGFEGGKGCVLLLHLQTGAASGHGNASDAWKWWFYLFFRDTVATFQNIPFISDFRAKLITDRVTATHPRSREQEEIAPVKLRVSKGCSYLSETSAVVI